MKQKLTLLLLLAFLASASFAQKKAKQKSTPGQTKGTLVGIAFNLSDFNAPKNFGAKSNAVSTSVTNMAKGVSFMYWKGLCPKLDFSAKLNGIFYDYSAIYYNTPGKTEIGLELEPTINFRPVKDENMWAPFITAGIGAGLYTNHVGAYVPLGIGLQFNANSSIYFFLQGQYKASLTPKVLGDNLFYSLGFAQNIKD